MKNTMKRAIALILTLALAIPMMTIGLVALEDEAVIGTQTPVAEGNKLVWTEDFSNAKIDTVANNMALITDSGWMGKLETAGKVPTVEIKDNKLVYIMENNGYNYILAAPTTSGANNYTYTGKFVISALPSSNYATFTFSPYNGNPLGAGVHVRPWASAFKVSPYCADANMGTTSDQPEPANNGASFIGKEVSFKMVRSGANVTFTVTASDGTSVTETMTLGKTTNVLSQPTIRIASNGAIANKPTFAIYDLKLEVSTTVTAAETPEAYASTIQNFAAPLATGSSMKEGAEDWTVYKEGGNISALSIADGKATFTSSANGDKIVLLAPAALTSNHYTYTGEISISKIISSGYACLFISLYNGAECSFRIINQSGKLTLVGIDKGGLATPNIVLDSAFAGNTVKYTMVRNGSLASLVLNAVNANGDVLATASVWMNTSRTGADVPGIRYQNGGSTNGETYTVSNIRIENMIGDVKVVGAQTSNEAANDTADTTYSVRFIATIDSDLYKNAGFKVNATAGGETKSWDKNSTKVYTEIIGSDEAGTTLSYKAGEGEGENYLGGKYLVAITITDIPKSIANVEFSVSAYLTSIDGAYTFTSDVATCKTTVNADNTVTLSK